MIAGMRALWRDATAPMRSAKIGINEDTVPPDFTAAYFSHGCSRISSKTQ
jgi:hypothetical protein